MKQFSLEQARALVEAGVPLGSHTSVRYEWFSESRREQIGDLFKEICHMNTHYSVNKGKKAKPLEMLGLPSAFFYYSNALKTALIHQPRNEELHAFLLGEMQKDPANAAIYPEIMLAAVKFAGPDNVVFKELFGAQRAYLFGDGERPALGEEVPAADEAEKSVFGVQ